MGRYEQICCLVMAGCGMGIVALSALGYHIEREPKPAPDKWAV